MKIQIFDCLNENIVVDFSVKFYIYTTFSEVDLTGRAIDAVDGAFY